MWRFLVICGLALAVTAAAAQPAKASSFVRVLVRRQPDAPLRIDDCKGYLNDTDVGNVNYYLDIAADYSNVDPKSRGIEAVRLRFDLFDDFYGHLRTVYGNDSDPISAGGASERMGHDTQFEQFIDQRHGDARPAYTPNWEFINTDDVTKNMICSVDTVRFDDGSIWQAPDRPFTPKSVGRVFQEYMRTPQAGDFYTVVSKEFLRSTNEEQQ